MLKPAIFYKEDLKALFKDRYLDERYKYYFNNPYFYFNIDELINSSDGTYIERVSIENDKPIGYMVATIDWKSYFISNLSIVKFQLRTRSVEFRKDLFSFIHDLLVVRGFEKISFDTLIGNPAEKFYDTVFSQLGCKCIGVRHRDVRLPDGKYYDRKLYEILKSDYKEIV